MFNSLNDKVVIITGGTRGIGLAIAKKFTETGSKVIITGTSNSSINRGLELINSKNASAYVLDVSQESQVKDVFNNILEKHNSIDVLINNAGITDDTLMMRLNEEKWDNVLNTNLKGSYLCIKAVIRSMIKQRQGKIINMSSVVGLTGNIGQANYSASKSGLLGLTKSIAKELGSKNICVNAIAPGYIKTEMTEKISEQAQNAFLNNVALKREGTVDDVAQLALFLASDYSNYITGQVINVDGGLVM